MGRSRLLMCGLGVFVLLGTVVSLAGNSAEKSAEKNKPAATKAAPPVFRTGVEAIEAALAKPIDCEFVETPLRDVIDYFQDLLHVEIFLDASALKEAGIAPDTAVNCHLRGLRFEKVLNLVLNEIQLKWTIHDDVLYIASPDRIGSFIETRAYDVADLIVYQDEKGQKVDEYQPLTDVITTNISPCNWEHNGGKGSISGASLGTAKVLVVAQTREVHREIADLLSEIRTTAAKKSGGGDLPIREHHKPAKGPVGIGTGKPGWDESALAPVIRSSKRRWLPAQSG